MKTTIIKGQFISVTRNLSTESVDEKLYKTSSLRGHITNEQKYSSVMVCAYEKLADVKKERADGKEKQKPSWWSWVDFPYIAQHKSKGTQYLVVKTTTRTKIKSDYFVDGRKTLKSALSEHFKASSSDIGRCIFIPINEITHINGKPIK